MKNMAKFNLILPWIFCCAWSGLQAQQGFQRRAMLDSVQAPGFYQINLLPNLTAALRSDMTDLRIKGNGKEIPYILKSDVPFFNEDKFKELPILSARREADGQTHIVIENKLRLTLDELTLVIKNTDADRIVTLSGSDDNIKWFVIKEHIFLNSYFNNSTDRFVQALTFPKSTYYYFKIIINGKNLLAVNIIKAGIYEQSLRRGKYFPVPAPLLFQNDSSNKYSYITARFNDNYFVDRLVLQVKGPKFYKRAAELYTDEGGVQVLRGSFLITSEKESVVPVTVKAKRLLIRISNNDNPPLHIDSIAAFQLNKYLLAYFEKGNDYQLLFTDSAVAAPVYDLEAFKDSIQGVAGLLQYGIIEKVVPPQRKAAAANDYSKTVIWIAIAAAVFLLLFLSYKLIADIKKTP